MIHKIIIEIDSEKEWAAVCALSSLIEKPLSEIAKEDLLSTTRSTALRVKEDPRLYEATKERNPPLLKRLIAIAD